MMQILKAATKVISKKLATAAQLRAVGLSWLRIKLLKHDTSVTIKQYGLFGREFSYIRATELLHGLQEIFVQKIYQSRLGPAPYIIDCGANIGLSVLYFKRAFPDATIVAFEPDAANYDLLKRNIAAYSLTNVEAVQQAVWNEETTLHFHGSGSMGSSLNAQGGTDSYEVQTARLGPLLNRRVDLLKIDIEGAEYEVMQDIADKLQVVERIFVEYHSGFADAFKLAKILNILLDAGFSYYLQEAATVYKTPFDRPATDNPYDLQLNIFAFRPA